MSALVVLASSTIASFALAQTPPPSGATGATPVPAPAKDNVEDMTSSTLTSPAPSPSVVTPAPTPVATPPAQPTANAAWRDPGSAPTAAATPEIAPPEEPTVPRSPGIRHGFYLRANSGMGFTGFTGTGPGGHVSIRGIGAQSLIAIGGSVGRGVVLAGTLQASSTTAKFNGGPFENETVTLGERTVDASPKADAAFSQIGLLVDWYPEPSLGWHVGASGGWGLISVLNRADDSMMVGGSVGGSLFGGYDWFIAKEWSMGLSLVGSGVTSANMKESEEGHDAGYKLRAFSVGIAGSVLYF